MATATFQASTVYNCDFTDLNLIYEGGFEFSLPRGVLEGFLSGKAFDHKECYTELERAAVDKDIRAICSALFEGLSCASSKEIVITAGAPGSGKTFLMESMLKKANENGKKFAYIDPDAVCLKNQENSYLIDVKSDQKPQERKAAYDKWRPASNAIANIALGHLIKSGSCFYYGTTASSPTTCKFLEFLKSHGYKITIIHLTAKDETRVASIHERDKQFIQTTDDDIKNKGDLFPQRIQDTYLKYADKIEFHYREGVDCNAVLAAVWDRNKEEKAELSILNQELYGEIAKVHDAVLDRLGMKKFEACLEESSTISK